MRATGALRGIVGTALALGCGTHRSLTPALSGPSTSAEVEDVVRAALRADAAGDRSADTLYAPGAEVVANARVRLGAPRLAGVQYGGRVTVAGMSTTMEGRFAWMRVDYRWVNAEANNVAVGRATFVCHFEGGRWRIVHVHSSQPLPRER